MADQPSSESSSSRDQSHTTGGNGAGDGSAWDHGGSTGDDVALPGFSVSENIISEPSPSVASLLSQLHSFPADITPQPSSTGSSSQRGFSSSLIRPGGSRLGDRVLPTNEVDAESYSSHVSRDISMDTPPEDLRTLSYQQSLLVLAKLSENNQFLQSIAKVREFTLDSLPFSSDHHGFSCLM